MRKQCSDPKFRFYIGSPLCQESLPKHAIIGDHSEKQNIDGVSRSVLR